MWGDPKKQKRKDQFKVEALQRHGITVIPIPYWWDEQPASLLATLNRSRPDIPNTMKGVPIPLRPEIPDYIGRTLPLKMIPKGCWNEIPTSFWNHFQRQCSLFIKG